MANSAILRLETVEGGGLRFNAHLGSGKTALLDSGPAMIAPNPVEMLLATLGGCEGMDVISLLRKKRQRVTAYEIELRGERRAEHPRKFTRIEVVHRVRGHELSETAIAEAMRMSETRYCSVRASLDPAIVITHRLEIVAETVEDAPATSAPPSPAATALMAPRRGMSELILRVADVARSIVFYRDIVGITLERQDSPEWAWFWTGAAEISLPARRASSGKGLSDGSSDGEYGALATR